ncbi:MAG: hypothetical protein KDD29_03135, partial [Flavobacteriales bacterium]|nr:hypothetical protein [Flavobacteriales bacterium]
MKLYNLHIEIKPSWKTYNNITDLLKITHVKYKKSKFDSDEEPTDWHYQICENESDPPIDFINYFLNILEPNLINLKLLGIEPKDILFWIVYEYKHQCSLGFNSQELERIGKVGIGLNIDCYDITTS